MSSRRAISTPMRPVPSQPSRRESSCPTMPPDPSHLWSQSFAPETVLAPCRLSMPNVQPVIKLYQNGLAAEMCQLTAPALLASRVLTPLTYRARRTSRTVTQGRSHPDPGREVLGNREPTNASYATQATKVTSTSAASLVPVSHGDLLAIDCVVREGRGRGGSRVQLAAGSGGY